MNCLSLKKVQQTLSTNLVTWNPNSKSAKVKRYQTIIKNALWNNGHFNEWDKIEECGRGSYCSSLFCVACFNRAVISRTTSVRNLFEEYDSERDQREQICHVTILNRCIPFRVYTDAKRHYLEINKNEVLDAIRTAKDELKAVRRHWKKEGNVKISGFFEFHLFDTKSLQNRKDTRTVNSLHNYVVYDSNSPLQNIADNHFVLVHSHSVVSLNGVNKEDFREYLKEMYPLNRQSYLQSLRSDRAINQTIETLARYPLKSPFCYSETDPKVVKRRIDESVFSSLIMARNQIGKRNFTINFIK